MVAIRERLIAVCVAVSLGVGGGVGVPAARAQGGAPITLEPHDPRFWSAAALALAATALTDQQITRGIAGGRRNFAGRLARTVEPLGRARSAYLELGTSLVGATLLRNHAWATATWHIALGYVAADAVTSALKGLIGRHRPNDFGGPYRFHPSYRAHNGWDSFPSGHVTHIMALANGIAMESPQPWVEAAVYGTAGIVAWSRVHDRAHWASDVVAGTIVGTAMSRTTIAWLHRREHHAARASPASVVLAPPFLTVSIAFR